MPGVHLVEVCGTVEVTVEVAIRQLISAHIMQAETHSDSEVRGLIRLRHLPCVMNEGEKYERTQTPHRAGSR